MTTALLLRTQRFGEREAEFLSKLRAESGHEAVILADTGGRRVAPEGFATIAFDRPTLRGMGLHCPPDVGWRCGDYGFYLARKLMPHVRYFWMIEPDVRAAVSSYAEFFSAFDSRTEDLLAAGVMRSEAAHFWQPTMRWATRDVYRCHFALCRMSARAADMCLAARVAMRSAPAARIMWPNDETFVATTVMQKGGAVLDFNASGRTWWTEASFGFQTVLRGEIFDKLPPTGLLYHPVLWGEDADRKMLRHGHGIRRNEGRRLKILRGFNRVAAPRGARA